MRTCLFGGADRWSGGKLQQGFELLKDWHHCWSAPLLECTVFGVHCCSCPRPTLFRLEFSGCAVLGIPTRETTCSLKKFPPILDDCPTGQLFGVSASCSGCCWSRCCWSHCCWSHWVLIRSGGARLPLLSPQGLGEFPVSVCRLRTFPARSTG